MKRQHDLLKALEEAFPELRAMPPEEHGPYLARQITRILDRVAAKLEERAKR